jgi:hypothetical protein
MGGGQRLWEGLWGRLPEIESLRQTPRLVRLPLTDSSRTCRIASPTVGSSLSSWDSGRCWGMPKRAKLFD